MIKKIKLPSKIVIASFNKGKVIEIKQLLKNSKSSFISISEFTEIAPEENGKTFNENALIKARYANKISGLCSLADDSGLSVNALNGEPGIFSSRWAGKDNNFLQAIKSIEKKIKYEKDNSAFFTCALALVINNYKEYSFEGKINGSLVFPSRGENGFGYDPIFVPKGENFTFAQMNQDKKDSMSHRFEAYKKMKEVFFV